MAKIRNKNQAADIRSAVRAAKRDVQNFGKFPFEGGYQFAGAGLSRLREAYWESRDRELRKLSETMSLSEWNEKVEKHELLYYSKETRELFYLKKRVEQLEKEVTNLQKATAVC